MVEMHEITFRFIIFIVFFVNFSLILFFRRHRLDLKNLDFNHYKFLR